MEEGRSQTIAICDKSWMEPPCSEAVSFLTPVAGGQIAERGVTFVSCLWSSWGNVAVHKLG